MTYLYNTTSMSYHLSISIICLCARVCGCLFLCDNVWVCACVRLCLCGLCLCRYSRVCLQVSLSVCVWYLAYLLHPKTATLKLDCHHLMPQSDSSATNDYIYIYIYIYVYIYIYIYKITYLMYLCQRTVIGNKIERLISTLASLKEAISDVGFRQQTWT